MRVEIKRLVGTKWFPIKLDHVVGKTLCEYMESSDEILMACLYQDDQDPAFVSNRQEYVDQYKKRGFAMHSRELANLVGKQFPKNCLTETFPGSYLVSIDEDPECP